MPLPLPPTPSTTIEQVASDVATVGRGYALNSDVLDETVDHELAGEVRGSVQIASTFVRACRRQNWRGSSDAFGEGKI
jgi:hypothetical protein